MDGRRGAARAAAALGPEPAVKMRDQRPESSGESTGCGVGFAACARRRRRRRRRRRHHHPVDAVFGA